MHFYLFILSVLTFSFCYCEPFEPFTGKVVRDKVRVRLSPSFDGDVLRELTQGDLLVIKGETEEFYAISAPSDIKAYIFRTFVLEGTVEGTRVNVRLEPNVESPIITQLNSGDRVEGSVCQENTKWLEIKPPETASFYIFKDFIDKVGDLNYISTLEARTKEVNQLLDDIYALSQDEMQKSFEEIDLAQIMSSIQELTTKYADFQDQTKRAKDLLALIQDHYLNLKAAYLDFRTQENSVELKEQNTALLAEVESHRERMRKLELLLEEERSKTPEAAPRKKIVKPVMQENTANWIAVEQQIFEATQLHLDMTLEDYHAKEAEEAKELAGVLRPYDRIVKNKPGDYVLINPNTQTPIAFLYSTNIDLQRKVGEEVTIHGTPRPDHHFAFPAYFVHAVD